MKKQNETKAKEKDETACVVDMEMNDITPPASKEEENEYENTLEPFVATTDPIAADAFRNHVCHMKRTGGFSKEYQSQYQFLDEVVQEWLACRDGDLVRSDLQHGAQWRGEEGGASTQLPAD
ncbi:hypothetical protein ACOMHN_004798 [Nucella lapillus]